MLSAINNCKQKISIWQRLLSTYHHKWYQYIRRLSCRFTRWKNRYISQSDDPHNVPPDENTKCDFSIEINNKYQETSETQTLSTFLETPHIFFIKDQTQQKVLRVEAELLAIKTHFICELPTLNSKIESLTTSLNGAPKKLENHPHKCCRYCWR